MAPSTIQFLMWQTHLDELPKGLADHGLTLLESGVEAVKHGELLVHAGAHEQLKTCGKRTQHTRAKQPM